MDSPSNSPTKLIPHSINTLTNYQRTIIKGHLINSNNKLHGVFPSFLPLYLELHLDSRIVDNFSDQFSFNLANKGKNDKLCFQQLNEMVLQSSSSPYMAIIVMDASIKNNIATSILHVHLADHPLTKTVHHAVFITSTEAELFTIRCGINQACNKENVFKIIVTDSIHTAKKIFDSKSHLYQIHTMAILSELCCFFAISQENSIEFWECPSHLNWRLHQAVDKNSKSFNLSPLFLAKSLGIIARKLIVITSSTNRR